MISRKIFFSLLLALLFLPVLTQAQDRSNFRMHAGISAMPLFDLFNQVPGNELGGVAVMGDFGCFILPRFSYGVNPYYAMIANSYSVGNGHKEHEQISAFGLNVCLRGYVVSRPRFAVFMLASGGFGVMHSTTTTTDPMFQTFYPRKEIIPVVSFFAGPGLSWNITPSVALEAKLPLAILYYLENSNRGTNFSTALPTFGLQFFFGKTGSDKTFHSGNSVRP